MSAESSKIVTGVGSLLQQDHFYHVQRTFVAFAQGYFLSRPVGELRWTDNGEETEIIITGQRAQEVEAPNKRPVISVTRGVGAWSGVGTSGVQNESMVRDDYTFSDMATCPIYMDCLASVDTEAQYIAWLLFIGVRLFRTTLHRYGRIFGVHNSIQMSEVMDASGVSSRFSGWYVVRLLISCLIQHTVHMSTADPVYKIMLRDVSVALETSQTS